MLLFSPIAASIVFNRFNLASSRLEVEGAFVCEVVGIAWLCGELVWLYACVVLRLNVTQTKDAFWLYSVREGWLFDMHP